MGNYSLTSHVRLQAVVYFLFESLQLNINSQERIKEMPETEMDSQDFGNT